jgi:hypothetical protein
MGIFLAVEAFVLAHRLCGDFSWITSSPTPRGYLVRVVCPRGVIFERWVLPQDAEDDLLRSGLLAFPN